MTTYLTALLAREPGLLVLKALLEQPTYELRHVYTHGNTPKTEGGAERPELAAYRALCHEHKIALTILDYPDYTKLEHYIVAEALPAPHLLLSLSWRGIVSPAVLNIFDRCINLHRGALPGYAGAEPVRRAIEAGERRVAITAHQMVEEVDAGEIIAQCWLDIAPKPQHMDASHYAEIIKQQLYPLYAPLALEAIARCIMPSRMVNV